MTIIVFKELLQSTFLIMLFFYSTLAIGTKPKEFPPSSNRLAPDVSAPPMELKVNLNCSSSFGLAATALLLNSGHVSASNNWCLLILRISRDLYSSYMSKTSACQMLVALVGLGQGIIYFSTTKKLSCSQVNLCFNAKLCSCFISLRKPLQASVIEAKSDQVFNIEHCSSPQRTALSASGTWLSCRTASFTRSAAPLQA